MAEHTAQINARISRSLKDAGDEALAEIGYSPTQLIRAIWEKLAMRGQEREAIRQAAFPKVDIEKGNQRLASFQNACDTVGELFASFGVDESTIPVDIRSWDEVYREAMDAHYAERGMLQ